MTANSASSGAGTNEQLYGRSLLLAPGAWSVSAFLLCSLSSFGASRHFSKTQIQQAAQDKDGIVWACGAGYSYGQAPVLFHWDGNDWQKTAPIKGLPTNSAGLMMITAPEGQIVCLWWQNLRGYSPDSAPREPVRYSLSVHAGNSNRVLSTFEAQLQSPHVLADSSGNFWISEKGPSIYQITPQGKTALVHTVKEDQVAKPTRPQRNARWHQVEAMEDPRKRIWFWSNHLDGSYGASYINGLLVYNGGKIDFLEFGPPVENMSIGILANKDASHCWVGMVTNGLYTMDLETFGFAPVPEPALRAFDSIYRIFSVGADWYFANAANMSGGPTPVFGDLWRWNPDRVEKVMSGLDKSLDHSRLLTRPFLRTAEGLWLGSPSGGWFFPATGAQPVPVDWRIGYPSPRVDYLFRVKPDGILLGGYGTASAQFTSMAGQKATPPATRVKTQIIPVSYRMVADSRHHLWHVDQLSYPKRHFREWDGDRWTDHAVPADMNLQNGQEILPDGRSRIWWLDPNPGAKVVIYDPVATNWTSFASFNSALQSAAGKPESLPSASERNQRPVTTADGKLAYFENSAQRLNFFDGKSWTNWTLTAINENAYYSGSITVSFSSHGRLALQEGAVTREFAERGWKSAANSPALDSYERFKSNPNAALSDPYLHAFFNITNRNVFNLTWDNDGLLWFNADQQLYRAMPGLCLPQLTSEEWHPFTMSESVQQALVDPKGKTFLKSYNSGYGEYYLLEPSDSLPDTKIDLKKVAEDAFEALFSTPSATRCWFRWRLDEGSWSKPSRQSTLRLDDLPSGKHVLQACAINQDLNSDPTPAEVQLQVNTDPAQQISTQVEKLFLGRDAEREKAIMALTRQPALASPALRSARARATPDQRWWIDTALQQVEEAQRKARKP